MKEIFVLFAAAAALCTSQQAHAQAASNNVSLHIESSVSSTAGRQFNTSRTNTSLGCSITTSCTAKTCYRPSIQGYNPAGNPCCLYTYICRQDGTIDSDLVAQAEQLDRTNANESLAGVFDSGDRTESYWGYINTGNKSSNLGRTVSIDARLDACLGYGNVDTYVTSYTGCISACNDLTKNSYCTATVTNNGASDTYGVCHDRCECKYGMGGTCDNL